MQRVYFIAALFLYAPEMNGRSPPKIKRLSASILLNQLPDRPGTISLPKVSNSPATPTAVAGFPHLMVQDVIVCQGEVLQAAQAAF